MLAFQNELCPELPPVVGNQDFYELRALLTRMDELIVQSGLEGKFVASFSLKKRRTEKQRRRLVIAYSCDSATLVRRKAPRYSRGRRRVIPGEDAGPFRRKRPFVGA